MTTITVIFAVVSAHGSDLVSHRDRGGTLDSTIDSANYLASIAGEHLLKINNIDNVVVAIEPQLTTPGDASEMSRVHGL